MLQLLLLHTTAGAAVGADVAGAAAAVASTANAGAATAAACGVVVAQTAEGGCNVTFVVVFFRYPGPFGRSTAVWGVVGTGQVGEWKVVVVQIGWDFVVGRQNVHGGECEDFFRAVFIFVPLVARLCRARDWQRWTSFGQVDDVRVVLFLSLRGRQSFTTDVGLSLSRRYWGCVS